MGKIKGHAMFTAGAICSTLGLLVIGNIELYPAIGWVLGFLIGFTVLSAWEYLQEKLK